VYGEHVVLNKTSVRDVKIVEQLRQLSCSGNTAEERVKKPVS